MFGRAYGNPTIQGVGTNRVKNEQSITTLQISKLHFVLTIFIIHNAIA
jgi:hypothetical protein